MSEYTDEIITMTDAIITIKEAIDDLVDAICQEIFQAFKKLCDFLARNAIKILENYFLWLGVPKRCVFLAFRSKKRRIRKKNMRRCLALWQALYRRTQWKST